MKRTTIKMIELRLEYLNELTNSPKTTYTRKEGKFTANIGNFHIYQAYGSTGIHRISNISGGVTTVIGLTTKRDCYNRLNSLIQGLELKL